MKKLAIDQVYVFTGAYVWRTLAYWKSRQARVRAGLRLRVVWLSRLHSGIRHRQCAQAGVQARLKQAGVRWNAGSHTGCWWKGVRRWNGRWRWNNA